MDYSNLGLDSNLRSVDSPSSGTTVQSLQFDTNYEVPTSGFGYNALNKDARTYRAIVSTSGDGGTFKNIQHAINYVNSVGGGGIFVKSGTHSINSDVTLYDDISIIGESKTNTYLDFGTAAYGIVSNGNYGVELKNFRVQNSMSTIGAIYMTGGNRCVTDSIYVSDSQLGINSLSNYRCGFSNIIVEYVKGTGVYSGSCTYDFYDNILVTNTYGSANQIGFVYTGGENVFNNCRVLNLTSSLTKGFYINSSDTDRSLFSNCSVKNCGSIGYEVNLADRVKFIGCVANNCTADGFLLNQISDSSLVGCDAFDNGRYGINVGTASSKVLIDSFLLRFNSSGTINDPGTVATIGSGVT